VVKKQIIQQLQNIPTTLLGNATTAAAAAAGGSNSSSKSAATPSEVTDIHKVAIESLQRRKKRQTTNSKISKLVAKSGMQQQQRARSVGTAGADGDFIQVPHHPLPLLPPASRLKNERYATTGMMMQSPTITHHYDDRDATSAMGLEDGILDSTSSQEWLDNDFLRNNPTTTTTSTTNQHRPQQQQRRMTARLSEFSQGMIEDLLLVQLDGINDEQPSRTFDGPLSKTFDDF